MDDMETINAYSHDTKDRHRSYTKFHLSKSGGSEKRQNLSKFVCFVTELTHYIRLLDDNDSACLFGRFSSGCCFVYA